MTPMDDDFSDVMDEDDIGDPDLEEAQAFLEYFYDDPKVFKNLKHIGLRIVRFTGGQKDIIARAFMANDELEEYAPEFDNTVIIYHPMFVEPHYTPEHGLMAIISKWLPFSADKLFPLSFTDILNLSVPTNSIEQFYLLKSRQSYGINIEEWTGVPGDEPVDGEPNIPANGGRTLH